MSENNQDQMTQEELDLMTQEELDVLGEVMNISMGAAATAVSTMLDRQTNITTPKITYDRFKNIDATELEPSLLVKISYVEGISGTNITILKRRDIQIIIDLLMGNDISDEDDDFEFDDMSLSAACEVMNQMMGASATAISEIMEIPTNISTPVASLIEKKDDVTEDMIEMKIDEPVVAVSFDLTIDDILKTNFIIFLKIDLAKGMATHMLNTMMGISEPEQTAPVPAPTAMPEVVPEPIQQPQVEVAPQIPQPQQVAPPPVSSPPPMPQQAAPMPDMYANYPPQMPYPQMPNPYQQQPYQQQPYQNQQMAQPQPQIRNATYTEFNKPSGVSPSGSNMDLLMNVKLEVAVVIGRAKQKIKDVLDFGQGTVVELDRQTGAPAEIIVNGQLLAYGDVIVVGDNFGIRVTEIVGAKELLDSLGGTN